MNGENADQMDPQQPYHLPYDYDIGEERKPRSKKRFIGWILAVLILALLCGRILFCSSEDETPPAEQSAASTASDAEIAAMIQKIQQDIVRPHFADTERNAIAENAVSYIPQFSRRYYLSQLSDDPENASVLAAACKIYTSARDFRETCQFPYGITAEEAFQALDLLEYDCPELFQLDFFHTDTYYSDSQTDYISSMELSYQMTKEEYRLHLEDCKKVIASVCEQADGLSDYEKELLVFDTLTSICHYDDQSQFSATAYGALCEGRAKCDGIAYAATWLLRELGLTCMSVGGYSDREEFGHAWNLVEVDDNYYALDLTQDVPLLDSDDPIRASMSPTVSPSTATVSTTRSIPAFRTSSSCQRQTASTTTITSEMSYTSPQAPIILSFSTVLWMKQPQRAVSSPSALHPVTSWRSATTILTHL